MKFKFEKGKKGEEDYKIFIILEESKEAINMIEVSAIINRFAKNELDIIKERNYLSENKHFWFKNLIEEAIKDAKNGINWFECEEEFLVKLLDKPFYIQKYSLDKFLRERKNGDR